jgi:hypothetical protein
MKNIKEIQPLKQQMYLLHFFESTNKDRYVYYHCIRNNPYNASYDCLPYDDPLVIPKPELVSGPIESIVFPIRRVIPIFYHARMIRRELQRRIQVKTPEQHPPTDVFFPLPV